MQMPAAPGIVLERGKLFAQEWRKRADFMNIRLLITGPVLHLTDSPPDKSIRLSGQQQYRQLRNTTMPGATQQFLQLLLL